MKITFIIIILIFILSSCMQPFVEFPFDEDFYDWSRLEPVIKDFDGELFADGDNITAGGLYSGSVRLGVFGDMLYCNDNGLTIWFDKLNGSLYRLNFNGEKEKLCTDSNCLNNTDGECFHIPFYNCLYSDGYLYFTHGDYDYTEVESKVFGNEYETREKIISQGVFVYRFDVDSCEYEKLIEFQGITECEIALNGRYLYAMTYMLGQDPESTLRYPKYIKTDFTVTRIDLFQENAVIVYSDLMNKDDFAKISDINKFRFIGDKIAMPVGGSINICNLDMRHIKTLIEFEDENIGDLYLYADDIYFISRKIISGNENENFSVETNLCRVSIEAYNKYIKDSIINTDQKIEDKALLDSGKREILIKDINNFCIDGDFLYYTLNNNSNFHRIKLDYSRELNFGGAAVIYKPEQGSFFDYYNWKVSGGYLYAAVYQENFILQSRINLSSVRQETYLF